MEKETLQKYRTTYPFLDIDIDTLRARPGLMTLLVNHLIDLDLLTKAAIQTPDAGMSKEDIESLTAHHSDELTVGVHEVLRRHSADDQIPLLPVGSSVKEPGVDSISECTTAVS